MSNAGDDKYVTTREAAKRLGVSLRTAQLWSENGQLEAWKTEGGHRRISAASVERLRASKQPLPETGVEPLGRLKVLVVEDDNVLLKLYKVCMTSWGLPIEVVTASNGYEALMLVGRESPDLMIADLLMDGIDGFQMIRTVINSPFKEGMEIVVVSGMEEEEIAAAGGLPAGVAAYRKPIPFDTLRRLCQGLLERRRLILEAS